MSLRNTPFVEHHRAAGAKLVPFAGYLMPIQYAGIRAEHRAVREAAGLFDVSHMGEFRISGPGAVEFVDRLVGGAVAAAEPGQAVYTVMCLPDGGIVDDLLVYRYEDRILMVVNAANVESDWEHVRAHAPRSVRLENVSHQIALLALQGPRASAVLEGLVPPEALRLSYYRFLECRVFDVETIVSRTGYTGEDGFELYFPGEYADRFWTRLLRRGEEHGLAPCGLGARDVLRLEMGYALYGNDIDRTTNPIEAGLGWTVQLDKPEFVGREALRAVKEAGPERRLAGFRVEGPRIPRHGMEVVHDGTKVGVVTSGGYSPSLEHGIGLAYVPRALARLGSEFAVRAGGSELAATVVRKPFVEDAYHARPRKPKAKEGAQR